MNIENTKKLLADFPDLYKQHKLPITHTCMCWGFETGDGWFDIIYNLSKKISKIAPQCEAAQVKEKFGSLRFYTDNSTDEVEKLIDEAEKESYKTCEFCGSKEDVFQTEGWISTICIKCNKE